MLAFAQNWFTSKPNPIGIDFGSDSLRLAQVQVSGTNHTLSAAASCEVPGFANLDFESRLDFFEQSVRELVSRGSFKGRNAVLSMPSSLMFMYRCQLPQMSEADLTKAIAAECAGKLPIDPDAAMIRHFIAGLVDVNGKSMLEVIALAAPREAIDKFLFAAGRAKLDVVDMKIEPMAVLDCFSHVHCRKADSDSITLYVDLGATGTRLMTAKGSHLFGLSMIEQGGRDFDHAIATTMGVNLEGARLLRLKHSASLTSMVARDIRNVSPRTAPEPQAAHVAEAQAETLARLVDSIAACRARHDSTFSSHPIQRVIFIGGEASSHGLCSQIAEAIGLPAQIGDPLIRMGRTSLIPIESGIDRRLPQPGWAVAIGLSFDAARVTHRSASTATFVTGEAA